MEWTRVKNITPYIKSGDYLSDEEDFSLCRRLYSPKDKKYPLFSIGIDANTSYVIKRPFIGIKISFSCKNKRGEWWDEKSDLSCLPLELFDDLKEMMDEVVTKIKK